MKQFKAAILAAVLGLGGCSQPSASPRDTTATAPLRPFYEALAALDAGGTDQPVAILQIGDSHTANDAFSGQMRSLLQDRFGNAGRGTLPPGIPFRTYHPAQVTVTATGWRIISSMDAASPGPFGLAALRQSATAPAEMTLTPNQPGDIDDIWIEALGQPNGGTIDAITGSNSKITLRTNSTQAKPLWLHLPGAPSVTLRTRGDGPVDLLSWSATRHRRGITYANLGTIGATADLISRWDPAFVAAELNRIQPALILLAFGTNEGFRDSLDLDAYRTAFASHLRFLHENAPKAAIIVMGPPDGNRRLRDASGSACPDEQPHWTIPPNLGPVREAQRQIAKDNNDYFWDWSQAMGGPCTIDKWARANPPMASSDHVHLLTAGYRATADRLFADIMSGYTRYHDTTH